LILNVRKNAPGETYSTSKFTRIFATISTGRANRQSWSFLVHQISFHELLRYNIEQINRN